MRSLLRTLVVPFVLSCVHLCVLSRLYVLTATELQVNSKVRSNTAIKHSCASSELTILKSTVYKLEGSIAEVIANITAMWLQAVSSTSFVCSQCALYHFSTRRYSISAVPRECVCVFVCLFCRSILIFRDVNERK